VTTDSAHAPAPARTAASGARPANSRRTGTPRPRRRNRDSWAGYIFLSPWLLGFVGLTLGPMLASLYLAFTDYNLFTAPEWTGLNNLTRMAGDEKFWSSVRITLIYVLVGTPIKLAAALAVAMLLN
jgi:multiple sugar transport system permease protein